MAVEVKPAVKELCQEGTGHRGKGSKAGEGAVGQFLCVQSEVFLFAWSLSSCFSHLAQDGCGLGVPVPLPISMRALTSASPG